MDNELGDESKLAFSYAFYIFVKDFFNHLLFNNSEEKIAKELISISNGLDVAKKDRDNNP